MLLRAPINIFCILLLYSAAAMLLMGRGTLGYTWLWRDETYPPPELIKEWAPLHDRCVNETGVTEAAIKEFSDGEVHEDEKLKCYMSCMFDALDVRNEDGEVNLIKLANRLPESIIEIALSMGYGCQHPKGDSKCERAFWLHRCWKQAVPQHYFLI